MLIMAINTASSKTAIALLERTNSKAKNLAKSHLKETTNNFTNNPSNNLANNSTKILAEDCWQSKNDEAEKLMPAIAKLFKKANLSQKIQSIQTNKPTSKTQKAQPAKTEQFLQKTQSLQNHKLTFSDIKEVFVIRGPGSFTGLRVGITVANTIAYLNKCDLFAISTFEYWHALSDLPVLIFAGKGGVYLSENSNFKNSQLVNLPDLNKILKEKNIKKVFGDISDEQKNTLTSAKFIKFSETFGEVMRKIIQKNIQNSDRSPRQTSPQTIAESRMKKHSKRAAADSCASIKIVEPLYIKKPGITQIKKCYT